jgi:outer membrane cobalamin receptor
VHYSLLVLCLTALRAEQIHGRVTDGRSGEALAKVEIKCRESGEFARTGSDGRFTLDIGNAACTLRIATVGYRPVTQKVEGATELDVALMPDTMTKSEAVQVSAGPFATETADSVSLAGNELRNLSSVLADDPLRAIQSLPGVTAQNDFQSQFALRGAGFARVGMLVDGVLLHAPFHAVVGDATDASITNFQGEILETANLIPGPIPSQFSDRTGGILDLETRDGNASGLKFRINAGISAVGGSAEGKLGDKGTWLVAARQSYLQYLLDRLTTEPGLAFEYRDVQAKAAYALTPHHHFSLLLMDGVSSLNRNSVASTLGLNSLDTSSFNSTTAIATWRYTPNATWIVTNRVAYLRERYGEENKTPSPLEQGFYGEWAWYGGAAKQWGGFGSTDFGGTFRRIREDGYEDKLFTPPTPASLLDRFRGSGTLGGFYGRQSWKFKKRLRLEAGARSDWHSGPQPQVVSPYASLTADAWKGGSITASWAQAAQFAEVSQLTSILGRPNLLPERSSQAQLTVQQMFGESTRLRVDVYDRLDRDLIFQPLYDPRFLNAVVFSGNLLAPLQNSQRGYGKGAEIFLQRRSANRLSGWVSYAYAVSRVHDGVLNLSAPSEYDLRNSVHVYGSYRLTSTINLSGRFAYGSGLPEPGFFELRKGVTYLSTNFNQLRLPAYQRTDFRINKAFVKKKIQLTLFAEVVNITNYSNMIFDNLSSFNTKTGLASIQLDKTFPILPAAGLVIDF